MNKLTVFSTILIVAGLLGGALGTGSARAAAGPWAAQEESSLRLLAASDTAGPGETLSAGLHFKLEPGWKVYWRSPGDAGYPPQLDWSGSGNLAEAEVHWPVPHRFSLFGLETFGYGEEVVLPLTLRPERSGEAVSLRAQVSYLVCKEICIPRDATLALDLPAGHGEASAAAYLIDSFRMQVPGLGPDPGMAIESAVLTGTNEAPVVEVTARAQKPFAAPDVLIEAPPGFGFGAPEITFGAARTEARLRLAATSTGGGVLEGKPLTLTLVDGAHGVESQIIARYAPGHGPRLAATTATSDAPVSALGFATILGLALLGGLILNLMPCVLPVLSIKLLSVVKHGGRAPGAVRISFLASAAGILASFLVLAGAAILLKALGLSVGWGIQFQQPLFLAAMAVIVTLFACNLFGLYEINLPAWAQGAATFGQTPGPRPGPGHEPSLAGHFLTGALATLLATPCSAPFLGTAVGFALARGPAEILSIFAVLGLGLAAPYLLIAALPALATRLPRPGAWMVTLRRILGLLLLATALWLLSVLKAQIGATLAGLTGALLAALIAVIWIGRSRYVRKRQSAIATPALAGVLALAAILLPAELPHQAPAPASIRTSAGAWPALDLAEIERRVAAGEVVFVDVTADWCLTCQVNKKLVLDRDPVSAKLASSDVARMRGDWTLPSEAISAYLAGFGRYGIPFNAVYGPGAPQGIALPEILTPDSVLAALARAAGG